MRFFGQKGAARDRDGGRDGAGGNKGTMPESARTPPAQSDEDALKGDLASEVEGLQTLFRKRQGELSAIEQKIKAVREEYDGIVGKLMLIKKELNQKRTQLAAAEREYGEIRDRIKKTGQHARDSGQAGDASGKALSKTRHDLEDARREHDGLRRRVAQEQAALDGIMSRQAQARADLEGIMSRQAQARADPEGMGSAPVQRGAGPEDPEAGGDGDGDGAPAAAGAPGTDPADGSAPGGGADGKKSAAAVIEAASAVVGSLKSRLSATQKELEAVQALLSEERAEHEKTRRELRDLRPPADPAAAGPS